MKKRSKTLVILTPAFPGTESETHWVPTQQLFVATLKNNYPHLQIIVLSFYYPYLTSEYEWNELPVYCFNGTKKRKARRIFFWNSIWRKLKMIRRENEVIGLFSFWCGECALMGRYFGKLYGIPHYCWLCGQDARRSNKMVSFIRPVPHELIAMSDFLVEEFHRNHGIRPAHMIPNGIDPEVFPLVHVHDRDIDIMGAGSLSHIKRYDLLVEVVAALKPLFPAIRAVHCGEGEAREAIRESIEHAGLDDHLFLLGERSHEETLALMQRSRVFLHTSAYEGFGVVCLEALYAGAQVISFCKPMQADIPNWHIADDVADMVGKAARVLNDPDPVYRPVLPYTMDDTVRAVMALFESRPVKAKRWGDRLKGDIV
jgi:glycosyltransferase involved in cell wall biosynthesis